MHVRYRCITNNPMMQGYNKLKIEYFPVSVIELFQEVQRELEKGYRLLSHPLTSSLRPDVSPYKSILLSINSGDCDLEGIFLMEQALTYARSLPWAGKLPVWSDEAKKDFQFVDRDIIEYAIERNA